MAVNAELSLAMQQALADAAARGVPVAKYTATGQPDPAQPQPDPNAANPATQQAIANGVQDPAQQALEKPEEVIQASFTLESGDHDFAANNNTLANLWNPGEDRGQGTGGPGMFA